MPCGCVVPMYAELPKYGINTLDCSLKLTGLCEEVMISFKCRLQFVARLASRARSTASTSMSKPARLDWVKVLAGSGLVT